MRISRPAVSGNYLWLNEDTELLGSHEAVLDAMRWPVTLHATPKGTMFQHDFGPYAMRDQAWEFMQQIIIGIWPALRALAEHVEWWNSLIVCRCRQAS